jgi:hypothetical protein
MPMSSPEVNILLLKILCNNLRLVCEKNTTKNQISLHIRIVTWSICIKKKEVFVLITRNIFGMITPFIIYPCTIFAKYS